MDDEDMDSLSAMNKGQRPDRQPSAIQQQFYVDVAKLCLTHRKPLVTTSYVSLGDAGIA